MIEAFVTAFIWYFWAAVFVWTCMGIAFLVQVYLMIKDHRKSPKGEGD